jgi:hypothetical protein
MSDKTGGPAFPAKNYIVPRDLADKHVAELRVTQGMTLRDYFAAKAMQALLPIWVQDGDFDLCIRAYQTADNMLRARGDL